ncbi:hypothetical protein Hanom_Chr16g01418111 [Helianthus anomalus]
MSCDLAGNDDGGYFTGSCLSSFIGEFICCKCGGIQIRCTKSWEGHNKRT